MVTKARNARECIQVSSIYAVCPAACFGLPYGLPYGDAQRRGSAQTSDCDTYDLFL